MTKNKMTVAKNIVPKLLQYKYKCKMTKQNEC